MSKSKRKSFTVSMAALLCTVLTLSGTFAWQSISQQAVNENQAKLNPGARLHDDYDGTQIIYDSWNHNLRIIKNYNKTCFTFVFNLIMFWKSMSNFIKLRHKITLDINFWFFQKLINFFCNIATSRSFFV